MSSNVPVMISHEIVHAVIIQSGQESKFPSNRNLKSRSRNEGVGDIVEELLRGTYCVVCMVVSEEVVLAFWRLEFEAIDHERRPCNGKDKYQHLGHCQGVFTLERLLHAGKAAALHAK